MTKKGHRENKLDLKLKTIKERTYNAKFQKKILHN